MARGRSARWVVLATTLGLLGVPSISAAAPLTEAQDLLVLDGPTAAVAADRSSPPPPLLSVAETLGRVALVFGPAQTTDTDVSSVVVRRRTVGGTWADLATLPRPTSSHTTYVDRTASPGVPYEYALVADGSLGRGPQGPAWMVTNARADLLGSVDGASPIGTRGVGHALHWFRDEGPLDEVSALAPSPDGRTVVEVRGYPASTQLWRRPSLGTGAAVALTTLAGRNADPAWSPDGRSVAFTNTTGSAPSVWVVPAAGGDPRQVLAGLSNPTWDRDGQHLIAEDHRPGGSGALVRTTLNGRTVATITGTAGGRDPAVSPDGRFLAFSVPSGRNATLVVRHLATEGQGLSWAADAAYTEPSWTVDGRQVVASVTSQPGTRFASRGLGTFAVSVGSHGDPVVTRQGSELASLRVQAPAPRALGVHLTSAVPRTGPSPSIGFAVWQPPTGTTFTCSLDGAAARSCTSPWRGSGVTNGRHRLVVEAREPSGLRTVTSHVWTVDATAPKVTITGPAARVTTADRATVTYSATDASGVASYDARYRVARFDGGFGAYVYPASWQATTKTSRNVALSRGREICTSVRARDTLGNRSAWSAERCTSRPLDDRSLSASAGWSRTTGSAFLDGTATSTRRRDAELTRASVQARQVTVIATRCPTCGTAEVFIGSTRVGRLDLHASTTRRQQVIALPVQSKVLTGKLTIRTTSADRTVAIDGVALRRT